MAVPQVFSQLTALTRLDMCDNRAIASGWQHLSGMRQLADLSVVGCSLTAIPQKFSQLTALTRLVMSGNRITSGWHHLSLLPLRELWTDDRAHTL